jgi:hypothetical protein
MNFVILSVLTQAVPVIVLLFTRKKLDNNFKLFAGFCAIALLTDVVCLILDQYTPWLIGFVHNIYSLVEMLCYFFLLHLTINHAYISKFVLIAYLLCLFSWIINLLALGGMLDKFQYAESIRSFFIAAFATISMVRIASVSMVPLLQNSYYLRSIGFLFYFSSAIILNLLSDIFFSPNFFFTRVWDIHAIINGLTNVIFAISIWQNSRIQKTF